MNNSSRHLLIFVKQITIIAHDFKKIIKNYIQSYIELKMLKIIGNRDKYFVYFLIKVFKKVWFIIINNYLIIQLIQINYESNSKLCEKYNQR